MKLENVLLIVGVGCLTAGIITINIAPYWLQKTLLGVAIPSAVGAWIKDEYLNKKKFLGIKNKEKEEDEE